MLVSERIPPASPVQRERWQRQGAPCGIVIFSRAFTGGFVIYVYICVYV